MADLEAFGVAVAGTARDLQDENVALRAKIAALEAQLAAQDEHAIHPDLASCPFCQSASRMTRRLRDGCLDGEADAWAYSAVCQGCAAVGPWAKTAAGAAQLWGKAAPWVVRGYMDYQAAWAYVVGDGGILALCSYQDTPACDAVWMAVFPDGRPMPKPAYIP